MKIYIYVNWTVVAQNMKNWRSNENTVMNVRTA
jgi:hypothetical protein